RRGQAFVHGSAFNPQEHRSVSLMLRRTEQPSQLVTTIASADFHRRTGRIGPLCRPDSGALVGHESWSHRGNSLVPSTYGNASLVTASELHRGHDIEASSCRQPTRSIPLQ